MNNVVSILRTKSALLIIGGILAAGVIGTMWIVHSIDQTMRAEVLDQPRLAANRMEVEMDLAQTRETRPTAGSVNTVDTRYGCFF